jgi:hypothetical protein
MIPAGGATAAPMNTRQKKACHVPHPHGNHIRVILN